MSLTSQSIPNLFNGVSQQPAPLRHPSQCELLENFFPEIASGLRKRPPTVHVAKLRSSLPSAAKYHLIHRDAQERYVVEVADGNIQVWDLDGVAKTVSKPNGVAYLQTQDPVGDIEMLTLADHTFVLNKRGPTSMSGGVIPTNNLPYALTTFTYLSPSRDNYNVKYQMTVNGQVATAYLVHPYDIGESGWPRPDFSTLPGVLKSLADQLALKLPGWTCMVQGGVAVACYAPNTGTPVPSVSSLVSINGIDYPSYHSDSTGTTTGIGAITGSVQRFSALPTSGQTVGDTWQITGDPDNGFDSYWVKWNGSVWVETTQPGLGATFAAGSLPHLLVREADGTFTFKLATWDARNTGDNTSNPLPSFVGRPIRNLFFYRNRLGFLSDENIILSRTGGYFNFWAETATAVLDTDPVDVSTPHAQVSILRHAVPFNKALLLFSERTQFQLTAGDVLSPKSPRLDVVTEFESAERVRPVGVGPSLYFVSELGNHASVREYFVDQDAVTNDAADITAHVPAYLPTGTTTLVASPAGDLLALASDTERNSLYCYKFYWGKEEKIQSAWFKFPLPDTDSILGASFVGNRLYLVIQRADGVYLEYMDFQVGLATAGLGLMVHLDRLVTLTGTFDSANNWTTWTLPYAENGQLSVILGEAFPGQKGASLSNLTRPSSTAVRATGNYASAPVWIGRNYVARYRFSEQFVKDGNGVAITGGKLKMRRMSVAYDKTGYFRVEVTPFARETYTYPFTGKVLGAASLLIGSPTLHSGSFRFPIQTDSKGVTIDIINDSHLPCHLQSAEWEAEFILQAQRR